MSHDDMRSVKGQKINTLFCNQLFEIFAHVNKCVQLTFMCNNNHYTCNWEGLRTLKELSKKSFKEMIVMSCGFKQTATSAAYRARRGPTSCSPGS